jgi:hypothetical protein
MIIVLRMGHGTGGVVQAVESLPSKVETLNSNPNAAKKKKGGDRTRNYIHTNTHT